jgi:hypothetical protein
VFGVGGEDKKNSSSWILKKYKKNSVNWIMKGQIEVLGTNYGLSSF